MYLGRFAESMLAIQIGLGLDCANNATGRIRYYDPNTQPLIERQVWLLHNLMYVELLGVAVGSPLVPPSVIFRSVPHLYLQL